MTSGLKDKLFRQINKNNNWNCLYSLQQANYKGDGKRFCARLAPGMWLKTENSN